jgi:hypothetical protein
VVTQWKARLAASNSRTSPSSLAGTIGSEVTPKETTKRSVILVIKAIVFAVTKVPFAAKLLAKAELVSVYDTKKHHSVG